ncbi:hypothetical protein [Nitrososphaeria virus YSH_922147]|uniref:Uncharacterized protein n=1 Tax=Nitrososphaeria virus YSH_922147 TaxID=3071323 RepID=A0A976YF83_9CAUD|nr:hypothetical protein QKV94_gp03 [Yangshan Harbor Nitrososphaeria virus]UVF62412.1 hypothetical protein [Nitrososphaeria virus YSH_922147]
MICDRCVWGHNNHRDIEEPNHCKCLCHGQFGLDTVSTPITKYRNGDAK